MDYRFYKSSVDANLRSGPKTITLSYRSTFKLDGQDVIVDGVVYKVKPSLVAELKRRSVKIRPQKVHKSIDEFLDLHGIDVSDTLARRLLRAKYSDKVGHAFKGGNAYAWFTYRLPEGEVRVAFNLNANVFGLSIWTGSTVKIAEGPEWEQFKQFAKKFGIWLRAKYGIRLGKRRYGSSLLANVNFVDGTQFSGRVKSYLYGWSIS